VVIARGDIGTLSRVQFVAGDGWILIAIVAWAFYSWMLARPPAHLHGAGRPLVQGEGAAGGRPWNWAETLLVQVLFGLLFAGGAAGLEQVAGAGAMPWNGWVLAALAFVALGPSIVAYRCWGLGVSRGGPALAAFFGNLTPVFAALLSAALLGEPPHAYHALAFALILAGIAVSSTRTGGRA
jgi:drug/metabolite transporter (DMT)-like permease